MEIYTIQSPEILDEIERKGFYRPAPHLCMDATDGWYSFRICYRWMIDTLYKRCGLPLVVDKDLFESSLADDDEALSAGWTFDKDEVGNSICLVPPSSVPHPVWGWAKMHGRKDGKPDMRSWTTSESEQVVRLQLSIDPVRLILTDFSFWHIALNMGYMPSSIEVWDAESQHFDEKCREAGLQYDNELFRKYPRIVPAGEMEQVRTLQQEMMSSWDNLIVSPENMGSADTPVSFYNIDWIDRETQCVFWEIRKEDIVSVEHFTTRKAAVL